MDNNFFIVSLKVLKELIRNGWEFKKISECKYNDSILEIKRNNQEVIFFTNGIMTNAYLSPNDLDLITQIRKEIVLYDKQ